MKHKLYALSVHLLTASGVVFGFWSLLMILEGEAAYSLWLLALAAAIDSIDGTLARKANVTLHTPHIDGALLDNLVDYITWVFLPVIWGYVFLNIPFIVCSIVVLASLFGFSHTQSKTEDNFFRGFPSYWNLLILYLYVFDTEAWLSSLILVLFALLVLAPVKLIYPSRTTVLKKTTLVLSIPFSIMIIAMLALLGETPIWISSGSLYYPLYYTVLSFYLQKEK
jgi:phosphatidylcholine synthase